MPMTSDLGISLWSLEEDTLLYNSKFTGNRDFMLKKKKKKL